MAITDNGTAIAAQTLLKWLMPSLERDGRPLPELDDALAAAAVLAAASSKHMMCGPSASAVRQASALDGARLQMLVLRRDC